MSGQQLPLFPFGSTEGVEMPPHPALRSSDTVERALEPFRVYMRQREFSENTISAFLSDLKLFIKFVGPKTRLSACSTRKLEEFLEYLQHGRKVPCSPKSFDRRVTTLKVFFGWLARDQILASDPAAALIHQQARAPLPRVLSDQEVEKLLEVTRKMRDAPQSPDARPHLLVTLLLGTAIKKSECMNIQLEHIDLSDISRPTVYIHYDKPRQLFKARRLALPPDWPETLQLYLRRYQPKERLFECTPRNLEYLLHTISTIAGLSEMLTFDTLRWTSATRSLKDGMDEERLRKRLGLSRIAWREALPILQKLAEGAL